MGIAHQNAAATTDRHGYTRIFFIHVLFIYTCISCIANIVLLPVLLPVALLAKRDKRRKLLQRLGLALECPGKNPHRHPVIWIHALSVGEVTSALSLIDGLKKSYPQGSIYFTTTTSAGFRLASNAAGNSADRVLYAPFDLFFAVRRFLRLLGPDLFILVETDLWPEWLRQMHRLGIPAILVNGRFSARSMQHYQRFSMLFAPMFSCFTLVATQTRADGLQLERLGLPAAKIHNLGNLKFDAGQVLQKDGGSQIRRSELCISDQAKVLICGSTHHGEEQIIFSAFARLRRIFPDLCLILAPRNTERAGEIIELARREGLTMNRRSQSGRSSADVLLLDTIGELAACYFVADLAFIGGSLVPRGGHNPIEAAAAGIPVLYGPYMDDFAEISAALIRDGGALQVHSATALENQINKLLTNPEQAVKMGRAAADFVRKGQGVVSRHLAVIKMLLDQKDDSGR